MKYHCMYRVSANKVIEAVISAPNEASAILQFKKRLGSNPPLTSEIHVTKIED